MLVQCPACKSPKTSCIESVSTETLAVFWERNWPSVNRQSRATIQKWIEEDLGGTLARMSRCSDCLLEYATENNSWTSTHYPSQSHGLGFDHNSALQMLSAFTKLRILEVGCGHGEFLQAANAQGHYTFGIDFSEESVAKAQANGLNAHVLDLANLESTVSLTSKFNVISMFQVIEHLEEPDNFFDAIEKVAAPAATLLFGMPSPFRYSRHVRHAHRVGTSDYWDFPPQHMLRWNPKAIELFLKRKNWEIRTITYEPLNVIGAAAELVAIDGMDRSWYRNSLRRRCVALMRRLELSLLAKRRKLTGTRMFVYAYRNL